MYFTVSFNDTLTNSVNCHSSFIFCAVCNVQGLVAVSTGFATLSWISGYIPLLISSSRCLLTDADS